MQEPRLSQAEFFNNFASKAATLDELLSDYFCAAPGQKGDSEPAALRLAFWCNSCASGEWGLMAKRLERDRLSLQTIMPRLARVVLQDATQEAHWVRDGRWAFAALNQRSTASDSGIGIGHEAVAFQDLFVAFVRVCRARRDASITLRGAGSLPVSEAALIQLDYQLLSKLSEVCAPILFQRLRNEFTETEVSGDLPAHCKPDPYAQFVLWMQSGGWQVEFEARPVLLRILAVTANQWIESTSEMLLRLSNDLSSIYASLLHCIAASNVVEEFSGGVSDPHNHGRSVYLLTFSDGAKIVYKPKDLRIDEAWRQLVQNLNMLDSPAKFVTPRTLTRVGYGWTEFIENEECKNRTEVQDYYFRAGGWTALFHLFGGTDMHSENIVAAGSHPVPVDLEMLLQPVARVPKSEPPALRALATATTKLSNSVLAVGLLPSLHIAPDTRIVGLGGLDEGTQKANRLIWEKINSASMKPLRKESKANSVNNLPILLGTIQALDDYSTDFIQGFEQYGQFLVSHKIELLRDLVNFSHLPVRKVLRPTRFYYMLRTRLLDPKYMADGAVWSANLEFMFRFYDVDRERIPLWELFRAERNALSELNIPHFMFSADGSIISDNEGVTATSEGVNRIASIAERIRNFDDDELADQSNIVQLSVTPRNNGAQNIQAFRPTSESRNINDLSPNFIFPFVEEITTTLSQTSIKDGPGAAWIGLEPMGDQSRFQLSTLSNDLYSGNAGIALFLAAFGSLHRNQEAIDLTYSSLSALRYTIHSSGAPRYARSIGLGGATGLGSLVYALTTIATLLRDQNVLNDARRAAALITLDIVNADARFDAVAGAAGGILGVLKLYRITGDKDALEIAVSLGEHLLQDSRSPLSAQSEAMTMLAGMSHGASGIAYALGLLSACSGREEFDLAKDRLLERENLHFSHHRMNWPDLRPCGEGAAPAWSCQWCHGAVGVGFARLGLLNRNISSNHDLEQDLINASRGASRQPLHENDSLCCGSMGNIEFLDSASIHLSSGEIQELAASRLSQLLDYRMKSGSFRWQVGTDSNNLGFHKGISGLGYSLLRRIHKEALPNVLLWE